MVKRKKEKNNKGAAYEDKVAKAISELYPELNVRRNVYLPANISGGRRQVDILVEHEKGLTDYEAKNHRRRVGIDTVASYAFKVKDEQIPNAIMVSNSEYSDSAKRTAEHFDIKLTHLIDTSDKDISIGLAQKVLLVNLSIDTYSIGIQDTSNNGLMISPDPEQLMIVEANGERISIKEKLRSLWRSESIPALKGLNSKEFKNQDIVMVDGSISPVDVLSINYYVKESFYRGTWEIDVAKGIYDLSDNSFKTISDITSKPLTEKEINNWPEITEEEAREKHYGMMIHSKSS